MFSLVEQKQMELKIYVAEQALDCPIEKHTLLNHGKVHVIKCYTFGKHVYRLLYWICYSLISNDKFSCGLLFNYIYTALRVYI